MKQYEPKEAISKKNSSKKVLEKHMCDIDYKIRFKLN